jgi:hypothetical protein
MGEIIIEDARLSSYLVIRMSGEQGMNTRLRLRRSFRPSLFGYVINDALRLTQPIRVAHPVDEDAEFGLNYAKQSQFSKKSN